MRHWIKSFLLPILIVAAGAAAFTALYLASWRLVAGMPFVPHEIPVLWNVDNITMHVNHNRWLDPLWAALWSVIPAAMWLDRKIIDTVRLSPLFGLAAAGGLYLPFWGEPGALIWPFMAPVGLVIGRILTLIHNVRTTGQNATERREGYDFSMALSFLNGFGFGVLLPLALMHGFRWAAYTYCAFIFIGTLTAVVIYGPLWLIRSFVWLWRKVRRCVPTPRP